MPLLGGFFCLLPRQGGVWTYPGYMSMCIYPSNPSPSADPDPDPDPDPNPNPDPDPNPNQEDLDFLYSDELRTLQQASAIVSRLI